MMTNEVILENVWTSTNLNILLIGNNPIEMGYIFDKINEVRNPKINTETAFNLRTMLIKLIEFEPDYVLIDDNIGKIELADAINVIIQRFKSSAVPITIIKNSNYNESIISSNSLDYILKQNFSMELLMYGFKNFLKNRRTLLSLSWSQKRQSIAV